MSRQIKFRAWCSGKHGSIEFKESKMDYNVVISEKGNWCDVECGWDIQGEYRTIPIMQFTGLKDKYGKEIYEGDILAFERENNFVKDYVYPFVVEWDSERAAWIQFSPKELVKVIGNIYENPELL